MTAPGAAGFDQDYWDKNYAEPTEMDGIGNAADHAAYLKAFFSLEQVEIKSVIDLGYGLGFLGHAVAKAFRPWRFHGIEPSPSAYEQGQKRFRRLSEIKYKFECTDLLTWSERQAAQTRWFDLALCSSVFQYLSNDEIKAVLPTLARMARYLYLTVPTDLELDKQIQVLKFYDEAAIRRTREEYLEMLRPHYTLVSSRIWESKIHFNEQTTELSDLLYRL